MAQINTDSEQQTNNKALCIYAISRVYLKTVRKIVQPPIVCKNKGFV